MISIILGIIGATFMLAIPVLLVIDFRRDLKKLFLWLIGFFAFSTLLLAGVFHFKLMFALFIPIFLIAFLLFNHFVNKTVNNTEETIDEDLIEY